MHLNSLRAMNIAFLCSLVVNRFMWVNESTSKMASSVIKMVDCYNCLVDYSYLQECVHSYRGNTNLGAKLLKLLLDSNNELECDLTCNKVESVSRRMLFALHIIREQTLHKIK